MVENNTIRQVTLTLAKGICELSRVQTVYLPDLAKILGLVSPTVFNAKNGKNRLALLSLLEEGCIIRERSGKTYTFRPLRPYEEIEVIFLEYKWDKRREVTKHTERHPVSIFKPAPPSGDQYIYYRVVEWLYENDGKFNNKNEWRTNFLTFLKEAIKNG